MVNLGEVIAQSKEQTKVAKKRNKLA